MLEFKELNVILSNRSISYCYYKTNQVDTLELIDKKLLEDIAEFSEKHKIKMNYIFPEEIIPFEYLQIINRTKHTKILPLGNESLEECNKYVVDKAHFEKLQNINQGEKGTLILKIDKSNLINLSKTINLLSKKVKRIEVILEDINEFDQEYLKKYQIELEKTGDLILDNYYDKSMPEINILTDRINLTEMNNCMSGIEHITIGMDGNFYLCPGFYYAKEMETGKIGELNKYIQIDDKHLLSVDKSPICKLCDAFHCKRCIYLNKKMTEEINIPSEEQCVISHSERENSRKILQILQAKGELSFIKEIKEIGYYDPFVIAYNCLS